MGFYKLTPQPNRKAPVILTTSHMLGLTQTYRGANKSLAPPGRKQARKHVRDARDFNNIGTRDVIRFPPPLEGTGDKGIE